MKWIMESRKNKLNIVYLTVLLIISSILPADMSVYAAVTQEIYITLPVEQRFSGTLGKDEIICDYSFVSIDPGNPMPDGSVDGEYTFTLIGDGSTEIGPMVYVEAGIYTYEMTQSSVNKEDAFKRDEKVYTIVVRIKRENDGSLHGEVIAENDLGYKSEILKFTNGYLDEYETESDTEYDSSDESTDESENEENSKSSTTGGDGGNQKTSSKTFGVKTGDTTEIVFLILAMVLACGVIMVSIIRKYRGD